MRSKDVKFCIKQIRDATGGQTVARLAYRGSLDGWARYSIQLDEQSLNALAETLSASDPRDLPWDIEIEDGNLIPFYDIICRLDKGSRELRFNHFTDSAHRYRKRGLGRFLDWLLT